MRNSRNYSGSPYGNSELFQRTPDGKYRLIRPFTYGLNMLHMDVNFHLEVTFITFRGTLRYPDTALAIFSLFSNGPKT